MRLVIPHNAVPIPRNTNFTDIIEVKTPTKADETAVVPTTPKCTTENKRSWYIFGVCN